MKFKEPKYFYNEADDRYITFCKNLGRNIVVSGEDHRGMQRAYVDGQSVEEICVRYSFPKSLFNEYRCIFGWTRDGLGLTDEVVNSNSIEENADNILELKKLAIEEKVQKSLWKKTIQDAEKWRAYKEAIVDPFKETLEKWKLPKATIPKNANSKKKKSDTYFVSVLNDLQIGKLAEAQFTSFQKEDWNSGKLRDAFLKMCGEIEADIQLVPHQYKEGITILGGDLLEGPSGFTTKGTPLNVDYRFGKQTDLAIELLYHHTQMMLSNFQKLTVCMVPGNHAFAEEYPVIRAVENMYKGTKDAKRIKFHIQDQRVGVFNFDNVTLIVDHGAAPLHKSIIPKSDQGKETYIQRIILNNRDKIKENNHIIAVSGDRHQYEAKAFSEFTWVRMGTMAKNCEYADALGLYNRAEQGCFTFNKSGLKSVMHYYA